MCISLVLAAIYIHLYHGGWFLSPFWHGWTRRSLKITRGLPFSWGSFTWSMEVATGHNGVFEAPLVMTDWSISEMLAFLSHSRACMCKSCPRTAMQLIIRLEHPTPIRSFDFIHVTMLFQFVWCRGHVTYPWKLRICLFANWISLKAKYSSRNAEFCVWILFGLNLYFKIWRENVKFFRLHEHSCILYSSFNGETKIIRLTYPKPHRITDEYLSCTIQNTDSGPTVWKWELWETESDSVKGSAIFSILGSCI